MENLGVKDTRHREYGEEESEAELDFYKSDLKMEIKSESIIDAESDVKMFIKEEIKEEYPQKNKDSSNHYQFNFEDDLHAKMNEFIKSDEVVQSMENGEQIEFKRIQTNKRKSNEIESGENKKDKMDSYCLKCQEFGHAIASDCIICFSCGIKGHPRRDCSSNNQDSIKTNIDTKNVKNLTRAEREKVIRECTDDLVSPSDLGKKWNKKLKKLKLKIQDSSNNVSQTPEMQGKEDKQSKELNAAKPFTCVPCNRFFKSLRGLEEHCIDKDTKEQIMGIKYPQTYEPQKDVKRKISRAHKYITAGLHKININTKTDESKTNPQSNLIHESNPQSHSSGKNLTATARQQQMYPQQQQKTHTQQQQKMYPQQYQQMYPQQQQNTYPQQQQQMYPQQQNTYPQLQQETYPHQQTYPQQQQKMYPQQYQQIYPQQQQNTYPQQQQTYPQQQHEMYPQQYQQIYPQQQQTYLHQKLQQRTYPQKLNQQMYPHQQHVYPLKCILSREEVE